MRQLAVSLFVLAGSPALAAAEPEAEAPAQTFKIGGYVQPQGRVRQDDDRADADENGFRFRRARLALSGTRTYGRVEYAVEVEGEMTPDFQLLDAYVAARSCLVGEGAWEVDFGQVKAPVSRQTLLSDSRLSFVEKAELSTLAPDRQLGVLGKLTVPRLPFLLFQGGVFNGEGRNKVQNVDQRYLWAGRVEVRAFGRAEKLAESNLGGDYLVAAMSVARNREGNGTSVETSWSLGGDVAFGFHGLSGSVEYLQVDHTFAEGAAIPDFLANGVNAQLAYLVPLPGSAAKKLEVGVRFEEIDRNDTLPIVSAGDANQSLRYVTGVVSWYEHGHDLKLQLQASHIVEVEDLDQNRMDASYDNDTLLLQAQYRLESL